MARRPTRTKRVTDDRQVLGVERIDASPEEIARAVLGTCGGRTATAKVKLKKMRSHYVPQFVLREFTDKHGMLWMYEKSRDEIVRCGTKDALVINGYYHDDLERIFAQIEGEQSSCLKAVLDFCRTGTRSMSDDQMLTCCRKLVLMQLLRTPYAQATGVQALDGVSASEMVRRLADEGLDNVDEDAVDRLIRRHQEDAARIRGSKLWSIVLLDFLEDPAKALPDVVPAILGKGLILAETESAFVLGDRGAVSTATEDSPLYDAKSEIVFPASPDIAVSLAGDRNVVQRVAMNRHGTRQLNLSTMSISNRVVSRSRGCTTDPW